MAEPGDLGIAERINAAAVAQKVHVEPLAGSCERRPERRPRVDEPLKDRVGQLPDARP